MRKLVDACREQPGEVPALARRFFADEYRLDYRIHTYPKPFICWAHGYVMGGGMGLMQGAGIRIVTPSSRLAMPEIGIGLYPDVGASWFLARLPGRLGLFLGLSAAQMNARDALDLDLADRFLLDDQQDALLAGLVQMNWNESPQVQLHSLLRALEHEARGELPEASCSRAGRAWTHCSTSRTWRAPGRRWWRCATMPTRCLRVARRPWPRAAR